MVINHHRIVQIVSLFLCIFAIFGLFFWHHYQKNTLPEKPIVAVITSFNNAKWVYKNLDSIFTQDYKNFRVIYCDDCSTDGTADLVENYVKEKNIADKLTLIRNKQRAIKLLNLYAIHHTIDDWDIIAQIDGDDFLANPYVFKEINKAYHNGCWLAYTQFECSNGQQGSNRLPPYWVRKNGTFREYKPTWFMYSHLKTFYAWLFKQVKLQDFIDDQAGAFPSVSDDVLTMYPMLEMARNHITFIPKNCYIWNVSPGFRLMPETDTMTDLQKVFFKKTPYCELYEPIVNRLKEYENACADLVIVASKKNYQYLDRVLQSFKKYVSNVGLLYVVYPELTKSLQETIYKYPDINFIAYDQCVDLIEKLGDYVMITDDRHEIIQNFSLATCIREMEKTFAYAFHLESSNVNLEAKQKKTIAIQPLNAGLYAYKYGARKNADVFLHAPLWTLYRKNDIALVFQHYAQSKEKKELWKLPSINPTKIGLLFEKSPLKRIIRI